MKLKDMTVEKIGKKEGRGFILDHHYTGTCHGGPMTWGLFYNSELVGVIAFATPISENVRKSIWDEEHEDEMKNYTTELHRLVTLDKCPKNTESFFISRGLNKLKKYKEKYKAVISFADQTEGHKGTIYQATSAIYYGTTGENVFYRNNDGDLKAPRSNGKNISKNEARSRGWSIEKRESKHRYLYILPDPYETKEDVRQKLSITEHPYP